ncbi:hypothetical protein QE375_003601 [Microbacterium foliorum]|uniref:Stage II sporulation protein M n=1 Tax=Microbacterium foliorum TaxID=104336 RepID=A0ABU1HVG1_9MICO|nr:hypothetical protein [Microbacterium foliorum]MDR6144047.1 hypothetical protein [Microbacterium foliorum]
MTTSVPIDNQPQRVRFWRRPFRVVRENLRTYLMLNAAAYGLTLIGLVLGLSFPDLVAREAVGLEADGTGELVRTLVTTPALFALAIFGVNLFRLSALTIVLPSLIVPFAALPLFGYWAVTTGITIAPQSEGAWRLFVPHSLTLVIELQAYILLLLGAFLIGKYWLFPRTAGAQTRRRGYLRGLQKLGLLALPALVLLVVGALWEAYSLSFLLSGAA